MARNPVVTFLMGTHNRSQFLSEAIESVLCQNFGDFEFVIVDDASTDETPKILTAYAQRDSRIRRFRNGHNMGLAATLNFGVAQARGEFLARMDDDDICLPERLNVQLATLIKDLPCVALGGAVVRIDEDGEQLDAVYPEATHERIEAQLLAGHGAAIIHPTLLARTAVVRGVGSYNPAYSNLTEDLDLFLRLSEAGKLRNLSDVCLKFRVDSRNARKFTPAATEDRRLAEDRILAEAFERRGWQRVRPHTVAESGDRSQWCYQIAHLALAGGNLKVARKHIYRAIRYAPLRLAYYKLLIRSTKVGGGIARVKRRMMTR